MIDPTDWYVKLVVETVIKTAASKTIEFGISKISRMLGQAIKVGDRIEATRIIKDEAILDEVSQLANEALTSSFVVPFTPKKSATADDLISLFVEIYNFGLGISRRTSADIYLPGSVLGEKTVSCFATHGKETTVYKKDRTITFSFDPFSGMGIFPHDDPLDFCQRAKEKTRSSRELTTGYIYSINAYDRGYSVAALTTQTAKFRNAAMMSAAERETLGISNILGGTAPVRDWENGITMMLDFAAELADFDFLHADAGESVFLLSNRLAELYRGNTPGS